MKIKGLILTAIIMLSASISYGQYNYHSDDYDIYGIPENDGNFTALGGTVDSDLETYITTNLPEKTAVTSENLLQYQVFELNFDGGGTAPVYITFVHEGAMYCNSLGFYAYTGDEPSQSDITAYGEILFPNVTDPNDDVGEYYDGNLNPSDQIKIGEFTTGTKFAWFVIANGWNNSNTDNEDWVNGGSGTIYSIPSYNSDGELHCIYLEYEKNLGDDEAESKILFCFEDILPLSSSDEDYNDVIFYVSTDVDYSLPVELSSFTGSLNNGSVKLNWTTGSETDNRGFILDRKENDGSWITIASYLNTYGLIGTGSTSETKDYSYTDSEVSAGNSYSYRLSDVSTSGETTVHEEDIVSVVYETSVSTAEEFSISNIYPNPFNPSTTIAFSLLERQSIKINVYDMKGQLVDQLYNGYKNAGDHTISWNAFNYPSGIYFVHLSSGNQLSIQKCIFLK